MEALDRHRGKGQQKVTVEQVLVHQGGRTIVGNVGPGAKRETVSPVTKNGRCRMQGGKGALILTNRRESSRTSRIFICFE